MKPNKKKITDPKKLIVNGERQTEFVKKISIVGDKAMADKLGLKHMNINEVVRAHKKKNGIT